MKLVAIDGGVRFEVWAKPRAKKSRVVGVRGDASQRKLVEVTGVSVEEARSLLLP